MNEASPHEDGGVLVFKAAGRQVAFPLEDIVEIIRPSAITRVPHSPAELLGLTNFRGTVVPVVSASALLGGGSGVIPAAARIVMIKRKTIVGLLVDEVSTLAKSSDAGPIDLDGLLAKNFCFQARSDRTFERSPTASEETDEEDHNELVFLAFTIARQEFALAISQTEGIAILPPAIARLPRSDQAMLGAAEIGGALVPLVSLRNLLGFSPSHENQKAARVVLVRLGEGLVGAVVDAVNEIVRISPGALDPVPPVLTRARGEAQIEAICRLDEGRRLISILSPLKLFDAETVARLLAETKRGPSDMTSEAKASDTEQFIVFQLGEESYGLPIGAVDEIVRCPDNLTRVPVAPAFVRGLMNLRGKAVPVIDQRERFSAEGASESGRRRIVVVTVEGLQTGFLVDKVAEVLSVPADEVSAAPGLATDAANVIDRVAMIEQNGRMILLVDPKALLDRVEHDVLQNISNTSGALPSP